MTADAPMTAVHIGPTDAQIMALGLLLINRSVWVSHELSQAELEELERMGLCRANIVRQSIPPIRWDVTDKLLKEAGPYGKLMTEWHKLNFYLDKMQSDIHPYYRTGTYYHKPADIDEVRQLELMKASRDAANLMSELIKECGRGLAHHWFDWKRDAARAATEGDAHGE